MPSRLGHGLYKKIVALKNIFRCIILYIIINARGLSSRTPAHARYTMHAILINFCSHGNARQKFNV